MAPSAQRKVPKPIALDLDTPFNQDLSGLLGMAGSDIISDIDHAEFDLFYRHRFQISLESSQKVDEKPKYTETDEFYQNPTENHLENSASTHRRSIRRIRNKDDPFYIASDDVSSGTSTPSRDITKITDGDVDVDAIPIMQLNLAEARSDSDALERNIPKRKKKQHMQYTVLSDETFDGEENATAAPQPSSGINSDFARPISNKRDKSRKPLLGVDSSGLGSVAFEEAEAGTDENDSSIQGAEDVEMQKALHEVERLRLEMQRASERVQLSEGVSAKGTLVKKKRKKKKRRASGAAKPEGSI